MAVPALPSWRRLGVVAGPEKLPAGMESHLQCPVPFQDSSGRLFLFFTTRDAGNRSHPFRLELDPEQPTRVVHVDSSPLLALGAPGHFDSCGVMPGSALSLPDGRVLLYYIGWNVPNDVPFHNSIGVAVSDDGGRTFGRAFAGPALDRNRYDPLFVSTPHVRRDGDGFRLWYLSGTAWEREGGGWRSYYNIKTARSDDGFTFLPSGTVAVDYELPEECALASPTVMPVGGGWAMWFCARRDRYRIMGAVSEDGVTWRRVTRPALEPSTEADAFDNEQTAYPAVCRVGGRLLMFYNGNQFGRTGIGVAEADE